MAPEPTTRLNAGKASPERYLTHDEVDAIRADLPDAQRAMVDLLVGTGMRWGEAITLHRPRVDLERRMVQIADVWDNRGGTQRASGSTTSRCRRGSRSTSPASATTTSGHVHEQDRRDHQGRVPVRAVELQHNVGHGPAGYRHRARTRARFPAYLRVVVHPGRRLARRDRQVAWTRFPTHDAAVRAPGRRAAPTVLAALGGNAPRGPRPVAEPSADARPAHLRVVR
ncbi:tyrosine-type recombinase/integrase [Cellulosimicrobium cellulans]|nr:tyrosine-type recombinase/integrase [Cellulosimicrobium cellulans]